MGTTYEHEDGCFEGWIMTANLASRRIKSMPSFKSRWSCPACLPHRFGQRVHHVVATQKQLVLLPNASPKAEAARKRAERKGYGFMRMSLGNGSYVVVAQPELFPDEEARPSAEVMVEALKMAQENGLTRLSFNTVWMPENVAKYFSFPTYEKDKDAVVAALTATGYKEGDRVQGSLDDFKSDVLENLEHIHQGKRQAPGTW